MTAVERYKRNRMARLVRRLVNAKSYEEKMAVARVIGRLLKNGYRLDDDGWVTLENGCHVLLGEGGDVQSGAGGSLNGTKLSSAKTSKDPTKERASKQRKNQKGKAKVLPSTVTSKPATKKPVTTKPVTQKPTQATKPQTASKKPTTTEPSTPQGTVDGIKNNTTKLKASFGIARENSYNAFVQKIANSSNPDIGKMYEKYGDGVSAFQHGKGSYNPYGNTITWREVPDLDRWSGKTVYTTLAHEYGHYFDAKANFEGTTFNEINAIRDISPVATLMPKVASSSDEFLVAVRADRELLREYTPHVLYEELTGKSSGMYWSGASAGVQDAVQGLLGDDFQIEYCHPNGYYDRGYNRYANGMSNQLKDMYQSLGVQTGSGKSEFRVYEAASEIWAHVAAAQVCGGKQSDFIQKYLPNSYKAFSDLIRRAV